MSSGAKPGLSERSFADDETLVRECLLGNEAAWSELVRKYKNLIYSIPVKYGLSSEDANEIFQSVCFTVLQDLNKLREPKAFAAWLMRLTARKCIHSKHERNAHSGSDIDEGIPAADSLAEKIIRQVQQEQIFRMALAETPAECRRLVELLFFSDPPISYEMVAQRLGLAKGSIGATRMRCLERLRRSLEKKGFQ